MLVNSLGTPFACQWTRPIKKRPRRPQARGRFRLSRLGRQVDRIAKLNNVAALPDFPDQVTVVALKGVLADAVKICRLLSRDLALELERQKRVRREAVR